MSNHTNKSIFTKNAVLFKDMSIDMKRPKILIFMLIFNAILFMTAGGFFIYLEAAGMSGEAITYRALAIMLIVMISEEAALLFVVTPAFTANTVSGERERQTLDVLLTTRMTPQEIVFGKFLSVLTLEILLILSTIPFLSLVFIYGGINFLQLLGLIAVLICEIAYVASFGVFFSALTKRTVPAVILAYVTLGILTLGTLTAFGIVYGIGEVINEYIQRQYILSATQIGTNIIEFHLDWSIFFLLFNPVVTIFDCVGSFLGVEIDGSTFQGMKTIVDMNYITSNNILIKLWTPLSILVQAGVVFGLLRLAGLALNPVKNTKKRERAYERANMKNVGVMQQPNIPMPVAAPVQGQENVQGAAPEQAQSVTQEMQPAGGEGIPQSEAADPQAAEQPAPQQFEQAAVQPAPQQFEQAVVPQAAEQTVAPQPVMQEQVLNNNGVE